MNTEIGTTVYSFLRLQKAARQGMRGAMLVLGYFYEQGWGTKQNYLRAGHWYLKAIKAGEPLAILFLGQLYQYGHGVKQDGQKSVILFKRAYGLGVVAAAIHLANIYDYGINNIQPNKSRAIYWYKIAAQDGHGSKSAKRRLAELLNPTH